MPDRERYTFVTIALLFAAWLAMLLLGAGEVDRAVLFALYAADEPWLALAAMGFTFLGNWSTLVPATLLGAALLWWKRGWREAALLVAISLSGRGLVLLQKGWFARLRPDENIRMVDIHGLSFPSGHSANSMMVYLTFALLFAPAGQRRRWAAAAIALSLLIGISRPMLGVHWPSDVLGGWTLGLLWTLLCLWVADRYTLKRKSSTSPSWTT
jgi:undecaprenyl-diphosphatase